MDEGPTDRKTLPSQPCMKTKIEAVKKEMVSINRPPEPRYWIWKPYLCVTSFVSVIVFLGGHLVAFLMFYLITPMFPRIDALVLNLYLAYSLVYVYVCFTPALLVRHELPASADFSELQGHIKCLHCMTLHEEQATHCDYIGYCSVNHSHHCSVLGVCIDGHKLYPFAFMGFSWICFVAAAYYVAYQTIGMAQIILQNPDSAQARDNIKLFNSLFNPQT